jgi:hypothetical protein
MASSATSQNVHNEMALTTSKSGAIGQINVPSAGSGGQKQMIVPSPIPHNQSNSGIQIKDSEIV